MAKTKPDLKGNHKIISFQFYYGGIKQLTVGVQNIKQHPDKIN